MIQKIVRALVLVPLAILIVSLAVANRQSVLISFDPFNTTDPAFSLALPLYALILLLIIVGVVVGGIASWLRQSRWRSRARMAEAQARELKAENDELKRRDTGAPPTAPLAIEHAPPARIGIPPPAG